MSSLFVYVKYIFVIVVYLLSHYQFIREENNAGEDCRVGQGEVTADWYNGMQTV